MTLPLSDYVTTQYENVRDARRVLLSYLGILKPDSLLYEDESFGRGGSIRNLLVHSANTYEFWIGKQALQRNITFTPYSTVGNVKEADRLFQQIDSLMASFAERLHDPAYSVISYEINGSRGTASPLKLFTHVITHEFHHKGQILSLSRKLGYVPVDTDIMR